MDERSSWFEQRNLEMSGETVRRQFSHDPRDSPLPDGDRSSDTVHIRMAAYPFAPSDTLCKL